MGCTICRCASSSLAVLNHLVRDRGCRCLCCGPTAQQAIKDDVADLDHALLMLLEAEERACVSVKVATDNVKKFKNLFDFSNSASPIDLAYMVGVYLDCLENVSEERVKAVGVIPLERPLTRCAAARDICRGDWASSQEDPEGG